ncbi:MAG: lamin tail domain-containing protein [Clostridia bacterium]|nr:lamin tail domain-containing protein [Clostridia bacterium]
MRTALRRAGQYGLYLLLAACLPVLAACSALRFQADTAGGLVINEVVTSNRRSLVDETLGSPDWIEFYNAGARALDLSGCGLTDNMRRLHKFTFPEGTVIEPGGYLIVYASSDGGAAPSAALLAGFGLSRSGDYLILTDAYDTLLRQLEIPALKTDVSYARRSDGSYGYCAVPTPGAANDEAILPSLDALFAGRDLEQLVLNEVMPTADESGYAWAELHNTGDTAVSLENYCLSDSAANPTRWQLPSATVPAGGYAAVFLSGLDGEKAGMHAAFRLGAGETELLLSSLQGDVLDRLRWEEGVPKGVSVVRGEGLCYTAYPSFEAENSDLLFSTLELSGMRPEDPVHINEAQRTNRVSVIDEDGDRSEWAELHNASGEAVSLRGYFLSDDENALFKWALPEIWLEADGYLVVFLSGKDRAEPGRELHASFRLGEDEDALYLTQLNGMRYESLPLDGLDGYNISVGLDGEGRIRYFAQPSPGYQNAQGFETAGSIGYFRADGLFISEVSAASEPRSGDNDWIELHNGGAEAIPLGGYYLSDDPAEPLKWRLPEMTIDAGGYLVIEASASAARRTERTAPFGLSLGGESLVLSDAEGRPLDLFETGAMEAGISSGRIEEDASVQRVFFTRQTPGRRNDGEAYAGYAAAPVIPDYGLYHTEAFSAEIRCADESVEIRYTTDGSEPSARSRLYEGPILIEDTTVLRAAGFAEGRLRSQTATADFLFETPHTLPVVCIDWAPGDMRTVFSATARSNKAERKASLSYYEADGTLGFRVPCGVKAKGAGTLAYAQKSMSVNLRAGYGQTELHYPLLEGYGCTSFAALTLRNGGQDWDNARIRDAFCQNLVEAEGLHIDNTPARPVAVYLNGAYWGLYDLSEDQNSEYLGMHYGADTEAVDIIRRNETALSGSSADFLRLRRYALETDLSDDAKFAEFAEMIDVEYFTDYLIVQSYLSNTDMFNQKYWRAQDNSVKWRPVFYDLDFGFSSLTHSTLSHFFSESGVPSANGTLTYFDIYVGLYKNRAWRAYCAERYVEVVMTWLNAARATALLDEMVVEREAEMERHIRRWGQPHSMAAWRREVGALRNIVEQRPDYALKRMARFFGLSDGELSALTAKYGA